MKNANTVAPDRRAERLDELAALVRARVAREQREMLEAFVRAYYGQVDTDDLLERQVADLYGAGHTPEIFVVDKGGVLRYHGRIDENYEDASKVTSPDLKNALDSLLAGKPVQKAETKAFGCTIKRI